MMKLKHTYKASPDGPLQLASVSFTIYLGDKEFGEIVEYGYDKRAALKLLLMKKHDLVNAIFQELNIWTQVSFDDPSKGNIKKLAELTSAIHGAK